jgi:hypothetical protein
MSGIYSKSSIRIPVKLVDGQWEFFYGGAAPIRNGTIGDLVIDRDAIEDKEFLALLKRNSDHKILNEGTELMVALTIRPHVALEPEYKKLLISMTANELGDYSIVRSPDTQFLRICIGPALIKQRTLFPDEAGGVWLRIQGTQPKSIFSSSVILTSALSKEPLDSLNHAFTRLSEIYEPWRKSHTGNIYERILYQEKNRKWYPLDVLRNAAIAEDEHQLIRDQWAQISKTLSLQQTPNK